MKQTYPALFRDKVIKLNAELRLLYYKFLGMKISKGVSVGRIECRWPNKITLASDCLIEDNVVFKTTQPFLETNSITIGQRSFIGNGCEFNSCARITVGNDCLIASDTTIVDTGHSIQKDFKINTQAVLSNEIIIADDVWIGSKSVILKGVTIGKGSVIGAGSVVNKPIPEYEIWAGVPARFIKKR